MPLPNVAIATLISLPRTSGLPAACAVGGEAGVAVDLESPLEAAGGAVGGTAGAAASDNEAGRAIRRIARIGCWR